MNKEITKSPINQSFSNIRKENRIALIPFLMAGDPDLSMTEKLIFRLQDEGADIIELGIPYSDPLADGPVIQAAASRGLKSGANPKNILEMLKEMKQNLSIPIILFTYSNPLLNYGMDQFCLDASKAGASGLVVPDLPLEEAEILSPIAKSNNMDLVLLVAPTTPIDRISKITNKSNGFTYLVSVTGVTGERNNLNNDINKLVTQLKERSNIPIAVGFGISTPDHIHRVKESGADGAIVGSAFVKRIAISPRESLLNEVGSFCRDLREAL